MRGFTCFYLSFQNETTWKRTKSIVNWRMNCHRRLLQKVFQFPFVGSKPMSIPKQFALLLGPVVKTMKTIGPRNTHYIQFPNLKIVSDRILFANAVAFETGRYRRESGISRCVLRSNFRPAWRAAVTKQFALLMNTFLRQELPTTSTQ